MIRSAASVESDKTRSIISMDIETIILNEEKK